MDGVPMKDLNFLRVAKRDSLGGKWGGGGEIVSSIGINTRPNYSRESAIRSEAKFS